MTCQELVELVSDYFEDVLAPEERASFDAHVAGCPGCRRYVEQMRSTIALTREAAMLRERPEVAGLRRAFHDWNGRAPADVG